MNALKSLLLMTVSAALIAATAARAGANSHSSPEELNPRLLELPANVWVALDVPPPDWTRQQHGGAAFDTRRGKVYVFGSDTHNRSWDNVVHELDPLTLQWTDHYAPSPRESYRADARGRALAGTDAPRPWAMHTYDNVVYDPRLDALVIPALPEHNKAAKQQVPEARHHPTWIYSLEDRAWRMLEGSAQANDKFFASGAAYDDTRDVVIEYKWGIWELGPDRAAWQRVLEESHHKIHYTVEYASRQKAVAVFGDHHATNHVWLYFPGDSPGQAGRWEKRVPSGDEVPKDNCMPVAYDAHQGVFLLVADNAKAFRDEAGRWQRTSDTFVYDIDADRYIALPEATLPVQKMNYMLVYDSRHRVFLLVTGRAGQQPGVYALRLDMDRLKR